MIDTRNFDRAPLKDIRVKDNLVGIRTPQVLIKREGGEYMKGDVLDANATTELAKSIHMPDIEKINEELSKTVKTELIGKPNGIASLDLDGHVPTEQLGDIDTDLFVVVNELPTEDIKDGKIYCIKDTSSTDDQNVYIEYAYLNEKWEEIGRFRADPDLSGYAKLSGYNLFKENNSFNRGLSTMLLWKSNNGYLRSAVDSDANATALAYTTNGNVADVGTAEDFLFTLEDGTTVTKSIRVISTTNQTE